MSALSKRERQFAQAGFNAGWAAALLEVADIVERDGDTGPAKALRELATRPGNLELVEAEPGPDGHLRPKAGRDA